MSPMTESSVPMRAGGVAGLASFLVGYLVTYVLQADRLEQSLAGVNLVLELLGGDGIPAWKAVGWLFYDAHATRLAVSLPGQGSVSRSLVGGDGASTALYLLPPGILLLAGYVVARYAGAREGRDGAVAGVSLVPAYFCLAVAGLLATRVSVGDATAAPDIATGVLLAGLGYPAVFGGLGGFLGAITR